MKNAFITLLLAIAVFSFFSFTNNNGRAVLLRDDDDYSDGDSVVIDTMPAKKHPQKAKSSQSKTTPYDSFGKPKKMDSSHIK